MSWGSAFKGAVGGGLAGFAMGGPMGAVAGAGLGGIAGYGSGGMSDSQKQNQKALQDYYMRVQGRGAPQLGPAGQASTSSFRGNQNELVGRLEAMSKGQGPSLAAEQLKAATDRNMRGQQAFANSGRGGPLAAQQAMNNTAMLGAQSAQDSAQARIAEQQMALNQLGLTLHGARGADEEMSRFNTGQSNDFAQANLAARLKTMGLNDDAILRALGIMSTNANSSASQPDLGDQLMAGGAGMYSQYLASKKKA